MKNRTQHSVIRLSLFFIKSFLLKNLTTNTAGLRPLQWSFFSYNIQKEQALWQRFPT